MWRSSCCAVAAVLSVASAGTVVPYTQTPIAETYREIAVRGNVRAQAALAFLTPPTSPEALHWMVGAAQAGVIECQIGAGDLLAAHGQKQAAAVWYQRATSKSPRAAFLLGQMYESGDGLVHDARHAALLYLRAANAGLPEAQTRLANLYMIGEGVPLSYSQARRWYLRAARQGYGEAFLDLAGLFFHGLGVPRDVQRARGWAVGAKSRSARDADAFLAVIDSRQ
jgi:TPR repeat protein